MKAVTIVEPGRIEVETLPDPTPAEGQVVVKVAGCGICGTDLHILHGGFAPSLPLVPGHEFAGEVVAVGTGVTEPAVGDHVAVDPSLHCGECHFCLRGRGNLCEKWAAIGVTTTGGAAEFAAVPARNCYRLPPELPLANAALIEPLSCAVRGFDVLPRNLGDHYLIYGAGTMGLMMMELSKRAGAASVHVVDLNPDRLSTAETLGCSGTATSADEIDRPRGFEVVVDCTGVPAAIQDGLSRVARAGTFLQFGVANEDATATINPFEIYNREITITGSMAVLHSFGRAVELFSDGVLDADTLISDRFALQDYATAIDRFERGVGRKIQITPAPS